MKKYQVYLCKITQKQCIPFEGKHRKKGTETFLPTLCVPYYLHEEFDTMNEVFNEYLEKKVTFVESMQQAKAVEKLQMDLGYSSEMYYAMIYDGKNQIRYDIATALNYAFSYYFHGRGTASFEIKYKNSGVAVRKKFYSGKRNKKARGYHKPPAKQLHKRTVQDNEVRQHPEAYRHIKTRNKKLNFQEAYSWGEFKRVSKSWKDQSKRTTQYRPKKELMYA